MSEEKYSFSRLESFHNCKRSYYNTYVLKNRGGDNIYSYLGTVCHELTQGIIEGKETNMGALEKFNDSIELADILGFIWISDKVKSNYTECITHFFENFTPTTGDNIKIEQYFEVDIKGVTVRGYIDLSYLLNGELHIIDLKTSSKYSAKDMLHKQRQLVLYAYALEKQYPDIPIKIYFNMLKYAKRKGTVVERNKLNLLDAYEEGLIEIKYDKIAKEDLENYIMDTFIEISITDKDNIEKWPMGYNPYTGFFCKHLCTFREACMNPII